MVPPHLIEAVMFYSTVAMQQLTLGSGRILPSISVGPAEWLKPVRLIYILIEVEAENVASLLRRGEVDWIGDGGNLEGVREG